MKNILAILLVASFTMVFAVDSPNSGWRGDAYVGGDNVYVSTNSIEALNGDFSQVSPPIDNSYNYYVSSTSALGYLGTISSYGPLGILGPVGAHGYKANTNGEYLDKNDKVVRSVEVSYDGVNARKFDLYENYKEAYAKNKLDNDTSFMVDGSLSLANTADIYRLTSADDQIVSLLAIPTQTMMYSNIMYISLYDQYGNLLASSTSKQLINFIQFTAHRNQQYQVKITGYSLNVTNMYRLFVTGSYHYLNLYNENGPQLIRIK